MAHACACARTCNPVHPCTFPHVYGYSGTCSSPQFCTCKIVYSFAQSLQACMLAYTRYTKPPSRRTCLIIISKLFFTALPIPSFRCCVCVWVVCVGSVIVKRPVLPPCVVDGRSRNPLYYYYYDQKKISSQRNTHFSQQCCTYSAVCFGHTYIRALELCESRGGRPGLPSLINLRLLWT